MIDDKKQADQYLSQVYKAPLKSNELIKLNVKLADHWQ